MTCKQIEEFFKEHADGESREPEPISVEEVGAEEESQYEPSDHETEEDDLQGGADKNQSVPMQNGDCEAPAITYLTFATALPNGTVRHAVQDIVLYLQMHGRPVYRFHSDKGKFYNHEFRSWLREMGIVGTLSEPSVPQSKGHAESTVRWIKDRTRALLRAASLPVKLWPVAASMAAAEQRSRVLNWKSKLAAPFGAKVHLRKKKVWKSMVHVVGSKAWKANGWLEDMWD